MTTKSTENGSNLVSPRVDASEVEGSRATSAEWIIPEIRSMILKAVIRPGERINVRALEKRFGVSHIPIREALRRLEAEGLVTTLPQRGAIAARVSAQELADVYDLRRIIEPIVARRAARQATAAERDAVVAVFSQLEADDVGGPSFFHTHWDLHWAILKPGATSEIERVVHQLWRTSERYIRLTRGTASTEAHHHHEVMVKALCEGDARTLASYVEKHLTLTGDALRALFDARRDEYIGIQE